ncbi:MAG: MltA domain-containing protein [Phycisphaeraceae bacterium]|nr:MltA domain-containing protein [Phycisphaeraceae bacterium]
MLHRCLPVYAHATRWPACLILLFVVGCQGNTPRVVQPPPPPDYTRPLGPGERALRLVTDSAERPDIKSLAGQLADPDFVESLRLSAGWYDKPSSKTYFKPDVSGISHVHAKVSAQTLLYLVESSATTEEAAAQIDSLFDVYQTVGWNKQGVVLFTGYYSPQFTASLERTGEYQYPLYKRPDDLQSDPITGEVFGRAVAGAVVPYYTRSEIETQKLLEGTELVYLPQRLDAYTIEVNGSAKLDLTNGDTLYIGHAGTNGLKYTSIGRELIKDGKLDKNTVSMPTIRQFFLNNPAELEKYIARNDRFVFFKEYENPEQWPGGALGVRVNAMRSLATDKEVYPPGAMVLVKTGTQNRTGPIEPIQQLVFDQDAGGAIRAPGRADFYFGIGPAAESEAGKLAVEGTMYYFFLKRDLVQGWHDQLHDNP